MPLLSVAAGNASLAASQIQAPPGAQRAGNSALEVEAMRSLGINPSHALQHPGFYYYMAAKCTEMRRERFLAAAEAEVGSVTLFPRSRVDFGSKESAQFPAAASPGFANEKKVDHLVIILEVRSLCAPGTVNS